MSMMPFWNLSHVWYRYYTVEAVNNKDTDQTALMRRLSPLLFVHGINRFSHDWLKQNKNYKSTLDTPKMTNGVELNSPLGKKG